MKAKVIYERALALLGYTDQNAEGYTSRDFLKKAIAAVNQIYNDLYYLINDGEACCITSLDCEILLPQKVLSDVMPYGVAMLVAQCEGDGDAQRLYAELYSKKRMPLRKNNRIVDVLSEGLFI